MLNYLLLTLSSMSSYQAQNQAATAAGFAVGSAVGSYFNKNQVKKAHGRRNWISPTPMGPACVYGCSLVECGRMKNNIEKIIAPTATALAGIQLCAECSAPLKLTYTCPVCSRSFETIPRRCKCDTVAAADSEQAPDIIRGIPFNDPQGAVGTNPETYPEMPWQANL